MENSKMITDIMFNGFQNDGRLPSWICGIHFWRIQTGLKGKIWLKSQQ